VVLQIASAALIWDSVWLEVSDLLIEFHSALFEAWTRQSSLSTASSFSPIDSPSPNNGFSPLEIAHILLVCFCNVFEVTVGCHPWFLCFPFNDQFHLRRHRSHWKFKNVTPIVVQFPMITFAMSRKDERATSNQLLSVDLLIHGLHIFSHRYHILSSVDPAALLPYFETYFEKPTVHCDIIAPWSVEVSTHWMPNPASQSPFISGERERERERHDL